MFSELDAEIFQNDRAACRIAYPCSMLYDGHRKQRLTARLQAPRSLF